MTIIVCPLHEVAGQIASRAPARLVSLLAPDQAAPEAPAAMPRLILSCHDIPEPWEGYVAPDLGMVEDLLAFGAKWTEPGPMLVHCWMGISRSTAAALVLACAAQPSRDEAEIARALRTASPSASPNPLIVALADKLLDRRGRLIRAAASIGRGAEAPHGQPFTLAARLASPGDRVR